MLAFHIALIGLFALLGSARRAPAPEPAPITSWIVLPERPPPGKHIPLPSLRAPVSVPRRVPIEPLHIEPIHIPEAPAGAKTDWAQQAQEAASAILNAPRKREFVNPATQAPGPPPSPAVLVHRHGDTERDELGNVKVWVSDRCYVYSEAPLPGTPDVFAGEQLKDLPAYKKNHPQ